MAEQQLHEIAEQQSAACAAEQQLHEIAEQQFEASPAEQQHCKPSWKPKFVRQSIWFLRQPLAQRQSPT